MALVATTREGGLDAVQSLLGTWGHCSLICRYPPLLKSTKTLFPLVITSSLASTILCISKSPADKVGVETFFSLSINFQAFGYLLCLIADVHIRGDATHQVTSHLGRATADLANHRAERQVDRG